MKYLPHRYYLNTSRKYKKGKVVAGEDYTLRLNSLMRKAAKLNIL